jgi:UDP-glucuronate 4-epimerase
MESALGITAKKNYLPMQKGDVHVTSADTQALDAWVGFKPDTALKHGIHQFLKWYREFYSV